MMKPIHRVGKRIAVLSAAACLILACSVTAFAMNLFGLKDLVLNDDANGNTINGSIGMDETVKPKEMISLQGFSDSKEYKAVVEWRTFLNSYDKDGAILSKVGNGPTGLDEKYSLYLVYSQEMADKLDEIVSKYDLKLHRSLEVDLTVQDLFRKAGTSDFMGEKNTALSVYMYEDGTFHIDGNAELSNNLKIDYQFMNCKKGGFTDTILNIGDAKDYDEWTYKTASGVTVTLSISPDKALVFADLDNSFVTINVLAGTGDASGKITASDLETFADSFDFSALN